MEDEDDDDNDQSKGEKDDSDSDEDDGRKVVHRQKVRRHWRKRYHHQEESTQMKEEAFDKARRENIKKVFSCVVHEGIG